MRNICIRTHRFFWRAKGRLPRWAILLPFVGFPALLVADSVLPPVVNKILGVAVLSPVVVCLLLAYSYFAFAVPALLIGYLGALFPEMYPRLTVVSPPMLVLGSAALILGCFAEFRHAREKRTEVLARYGVTRLPRATLFASGALTGVATIIEACSASMSVGGAILLSVSSIGLVVAALLRRPQGSTEIPSPQVQGSSGFH